MSFGLLAIRPEVVLLYTTRSVDETKVDTSMLSLTEFTYLDLFGGVMVLIDLDGFEPGVGAHAGASAAGGDGFIYDAVAVLNVPLIVVLGHDSCGAVKATLTALDDGKVPGGYVRDVVERVTPSILLGRREGLTKVDEFETRHVNETTAQLRSRSSAVAERLAAGSLAIAGVTYDLAHGHVVLREHLGDIGAG